MSNAPAAEARSTTYACGCTHFFEGADGHLAGVDKCDAHAAGPAALCFTRRASVTERELEQLAEALTLSVFGRPAGLAA